MKSEPKSGSSLVFSYLTLRKAIGVLGVTLPFTVSLGALLIFHKGIQSSISAYYYTGTRDVLVGTLWAIGFFMLSYRGYERADYIAGILACVSAVGITLFPTTPETGPTAAARWIGGLHYFFAALFFLTLIYFSLFLFTKTHPDRPPTGRKLQRNRIYRLCGMVMVVCILLIAVVSLIPAQVSKPLKSAEPVFWLETGAILAFGISWLTKGEAILKDEEDDPSLSGKNMR
jgi:hypothetical protein